MSLIVIGKGGPITFGKPWAATSLVALTINVWATASNIQKTNVRNTVVVRNIAEGKHCKWILIQLLIPGQENKRGCWPFDGLQSDNRSPSEELLHQGVSQFGGPLLKAGVNCNCLRLNPVDARAEGYWVATQDLFENIGLDGPVNGGIGRNKVPLANKTGYLGVWSCGRKCFALEKGE
ncbi:hypothetical protein M427DRAFT_44478 [Gonapodya prolifera JEL478]|uniref:Uncharacterized protein n=1 Tax=Gonapodya prolifera (strain JEL478) TaxID=1344416 RepID=A0A139AF01_GONPJ|nr:hypothetical protein M427DRAFT_44478 [Gonapodya prolifera JEL478]|eukprot:KXS15391.1 hypothetical protein M427DRAFT_44478 [Gonapodya prolifera JEL478]